ncbi:MAG: ParB N-terminal domain-containing protein [Thermoprotei archaeon]|nr:ParB N-terminal domain-containing protein [Thermoprotei archaeon]
MIPGKIKLEIALVGVRELRPHEKVIPGRVAAILDSLVKSGVLRRPLIVDGKTFTVIDGHHRLEALRVLGVEKAPAILVDYEGDNSIIVDRWVRVYEIRGGDREEVLQGFKSIFGPSISILNYDPPIVEIREEMKGEAYRALEALELASNIVVKFRAEKPRKAPNSLIILPPKISKAEVVEAALNGKPFPPKTTRHVTMLKNVELKVRLSKLQ